MSSPDNNKHDNKTHDAYCVCTQSHGLFIPNRHLSHIVAAAMLGLFFVFLAGFFCGKQHEIKHFLYSVDEDSFSDQISSALYGVSLADLADFEGTESAENAGSGDGDADAQDITAVNTGDSSAGDGAGDDSAESAQADGQESESSNSPVFNHDTTQLAAHAKAAHTTDSKTDNKLAGSDDNQKQYYAQLIGFGTSQAADSFARRLTKQGFSVKVEQCKSRTAKGKAVTWYQVVTNPYSDAQKLQEVVDMLAHTEKLKGVRVKTC
jgi:hypothetical protein